MTHRRRLNRYQLGMRLAVICCLLFLIVLSFALELFFCGRGA